MPLTKLEHYLVLTDNIDATRDFYVEALGMQVGFRPPLGFPGHWVYIGDTPVIHIAEWMTYTAHSKAKGVEVTTRAKQSTAATLLSRAGTSHAGVSAPIRAPPRGFQ